MKTTSFRFIDLFAGLGGFHLALQRMGGSCVFAAEWKQNLRDLYKVSLQQRARFYGYKQKYLGYCRVYLRGDVRGAFEQYVEHEADIHNSLDKTRGLPLKDWVRQFTLDSSMQPTRKGVIGIPVTELVATGWMQPKAAHRNADFVKMNRSALAEFQQQLDKSYAGANAADIDPARYIDTCLPTAVPTA